MTLEGPNAAWRNTQRVDALAPRGQIGTSHGLCMNATQPALDEPAGKNDDGVVCPDGRAAESTSTARPMRPRTFGRKGRKGESFTKS